MPRTSSSMAAACPHAARPAGSRCLLLLSRNCVPRSANPGGLPVPDRGAAVVQPLGAAGELGLALGLGGIVGERRGHLGARGILQVPRNRARVHGAVGADEDAQVVVGRRVVRGRRELIDVVMNIDDAAELGPVRPERTETPGAAGPHSYSSGSRRNTRGRCSRA